MIAHLRMYHRRETAQAHDRFWALIREALGDGPHTLSKDSDFWRVWRKPALMLAQTCGMPYRTRLHGEVALVGTPDYGLDGCPPGYYRSVFITRKGASDQLSDYAGQRFAYNEALSQSGWAAPITHAGAEGIRFGVVVKSGAHLESARAVAEGRAEIASLDAVTWELIQRYEPMADLLHPIEWTTPTPGLPYITSKARDPRPIFDAVSTAITQLSPEDRDTLMLKGLIPIPAQDYLAIPTPTGPGDY